MQKHMNVPILTDKAYTEIYKGSKWICCPICGKRQFAVFDDSEMSNVPYTCRNTKCKFQMIINL